MTSTRKIGRLAAVAAALLAVGAAGCGDEEQRRLLTEKRADTLLDLLEDAREQFDEGDCDKLEETLDDLESEVGQISGSVDSDVRQALDAETDQLVDMRDECEPAEEPEPETTEEFIPPPPTETFVPPETVTETTAPTTTEETEPETETEEEPPPEEPPGQENGNSGPGGGVTPPRGNSDGGSGED